MERLQNQFELFVSASQTRTRKQFRLALLIALVIAILLWQTQWVSLRPGLLILLVGQIVFAAMLFGRRSPRQELCSRADMLSWFLSQERFVRVSSMVESLFRVVGFAVLAYGFWNATHILWITLVLGVVYPLFSYFGVARKNSRQVQRLLSQQRHELERAPE